MEKVTMRLIAEIKRRFAARDDSEHEQAALRIVIVGLVLAYMALFHGLPTQWSPVEWTLVIGLTGFFLVALGIFAAICIWPGKNLPRRLLGMLADNGGSTWYLCLAGEYGFSMIGVFLFVTFGNGFRYGRRYLFASQALSLAGFCSVLMFVPYWSQHRSAGIGLLIALVVLPLYVSTLLKRIQEARAKAEEANLAKTSFLANMSHEMRTPLNGIVGVVDLLRTTTLSPPQVELVALLRHSISVLRSLVDDVLDITKIEAGRLTIELTSFDLHASINGLVQLMRPHAQAKGLALTAMIDPALEYRLRGDPHHLRQILLNLLGNAIKFTETGSVQLTVSLKQESEAGVTARFEVRDTGIGIAPEAVERIFERFVQADQSTTRKYGGTGLGTTIAKQLTELMGGCIGVESKLGEGSAFWVEIPLLKDVDGVESPLVKDVDVVESPLVKDVDDVESPLLKDVDSVESRAAPPQRMDAKHPPITLVLAAAGHGDVQSALRAIGEPFEIVTPSTLATKFDAYRKNGRSVRAIVAACPIDQACAAFNTVLSRAPNARSALIYVANGDISVIDRARVNSLNGAYALEHPTPRLIRNAIHATLSGLDGGSDTADLGEVLLRERTPLRILVADDNPTNQKIIRQLLESAGHDVILASDGEQALDLYEAEEPDLGIFDFNMPHRSGIEVIQAIRAMEAPGMRMPAVILSASVTVEARNRAETAGADEFIGKPFDAASLLQRIDGLAPTSVTRERRVRPASRAKLHIAVNNVHAQGPRPGVAGAEAEQADEGLVDADRFAQLEDIASTPAFLSELIEGFGSDVDDILERTREAVLAANASAIPDLMHTLKGAAVGVGATHLALLATKFEASVSSLAKGEMIELTSGIGECFSKTLECLRRRVNLLHELS
jgi:two-component system, sensor histidine kinase RpfC